MAELRRSEVEVLRLYVHLGERLHVPPAAGLADRPRAARQLGSLWVLYLTAEQITSLARAFYLRAMGGSAAEPNRFARRYGVAYRVHRSTGGPRLARLP
ncbi:MAG: hypothetical protein JF597_32665 [Streptomyces sp.]|uniref:DUF6417 family protein n=1 Tax=Streptomyces sp. TaxID=1931 RepID=UPI0034539689|nr:hypothetical protein [Streptomyces sp.]